MTMSDFLLAIAAHLNRTPTLCACGHRKDSHERYVGCLYPSNWRTTIGPVSCPCDLEQWATDHPDGAISDEEAQAMDEYAALREPEER
jgi:hypothetical protein